MDKTREELKRVVEENLALGKRIEELNKKMEESLVYIDGTDFNAIEKRVKDSALRNEPKIEN